MQYANFWGNPLYQATKRHLNNRYMVKNDEKKEEEKQNKQKTSQNVKKNATNLLLIKHKKIHYRDKASKCPTSRFSPSHCCLGVVKLENGAYPENSFTCGVLS